ncbi:MAG: cation diffusion facilitator family transporter [Desulfovibrio sp.]|nr:cation diffusion facilitator family transporter [Desulfovibrio sp.]
MNSDVHLSPSGSFSARPDSFGAPSGMDTPETERAARTSFFVCLLLLLLKGIAAFSTASLALLSEVLHTGLDLAATAMTWVAVRIARRPADDIHRYGHGRLENISALVESILLLFVCGYIVFEGLERLLFDTAIPEISLWAIGIVVCSLAVDINRVRMLRSLVKKTGNQALEADALHFSTDILASVMVLLGLALTHIGAALDNESFWKGLLLRADVLAAFVVAVIIAVASIRMAKKAMQVLMDGAPVDLTERVSAMVAVQEGVQEVCDVRVRTAGQAYFIDVCIGIVATESVSYGHEICQRVETALRSEFPTAEVMVHVEPFTPDAVKPHGEEVDVRRS